MIKKLPSVIVIFILSLANCITAQNEYFKWYFGKDAALDFMTNPPTLLSNSSMTVSEGSASIADASGNLLFYSDGMTVWDRQHAVMPNGTGLFGGNTPNQSCVILKKPGSSTLYYIFTVEGVYGANGLCYSIVDMSLAAGMGSVTVKNATLHPFPCKEALAATPHCNGTDYWIVVHNSSGPNFVSFALTAAGVNTTGVVSVTTNTFATNVAQIKISNNGRKLAYTIFVNNIFLQDFDNTTGQVSNQFALTASVNANTWGCEFSPDCSKLYASYGSNGKLLHQWDLCAGTNSAIVASQYTVVNGPSLVSGLQLAPDGKIYAARPHKDTLGLIQNPNALGSACNFTYQGLSLGPQQGWMGLPNVLSPYFKPVSVPTVSCATASFTSPAFSGGCAAVGMQVNAVKWLFGDPASGPSNTSTATSPTHNYPAAGNYTAQMILMYNCRTDTVNIPVTINLPTINVAGNFTVCKNNSVVYTANGASTYSWSTGAATASVSLTHSNVGTYTYTVTGTSTAGCQGAKTISVTVNACLGLNEFENQVFVKVFPNPFGDELSLEVETAAVIEMFSADGKLLMQKQLQEGNNLLDTTPLAPGIYTLRVKSEKGSWVSRLVKME